MKSRDIIHVRRAIATKGTQYITKNEIMYDDILFISEKFFSESSLALEIHNTKSHSSAIRR
jgi:hypothetical protein